jgi:DNA-directed RNA polymerase specialized sigma subunit
MARRKREAPEAQARLAAFAEEHGRREQALERKADDLRADRDGAIREAYKGGMPMTEIARVLKMSHQRVSQIVRS